MLWRWTQILHKSVIGLLHPLWYFAYSELQDHPVLFLIPSASYLEMPFHCSSIFRLLPLYYGYTWEVHIMPRGKGKKLFNKINQKFILGSIKNKHTNKNMCIVRILTNTSWNAHFRTSKCMFAHTFNLFCTLTLVSQKFVHSHATAQKSSTSIIPRFLFFNC